MFLKQKMVKNITQEVLGNQIITLQKEVLVIEILVISLIKKQVIRVEIILQENLIFLTTALAQVKEAIPLREALLTAVQVAKATAAVLVEEDINSLVK